MSTPFKYELLFDLSPDLLCIAGFDGYFKKVNPAVSKTLGYSIEELYARPINDFVHEDDKEITDNVRKELRKLRPLLNFENRYLTKTGEIVWLSWTSLPVQSDELIFAIAKNITHKKQLEQERNQLLTTLTRANKDLEQLTYTTQHDLRSPINNLLSVLNLINPDNVTDAETQKLLGFLGMAGSKLKQTIEHFADELDRKNRMRNAEEADLQECLDNVMISIGSLIKASQSTINSDFSKLGKVRFNKLYLESVFLNLITNAIKYAQPSRTPVITVSSDITEGQQRLLIEDNGRGFDMEKVKDRLFGMNQTFHSHSDSRGIGLYLVHSHVTNFGGTINVESEVGKGTQFIIAFPQ